MAPVTAQTYITTSEIDERRFERTRHETKRRALQVARTTHLTPATTRVTMAGDLEGLRASGPATT